MQRIQSRSQTQHSTIKQKSTFFLSTNLICLARYSPTLAIQDAVVLKSVSLIMYGLSPPQELYEKLYVKTV